MARPATAAPCVQSVMAKGANPAWKLLLVLIIVVGAAAMLRQKTSGPERVPWRDDLTAAQADAKSSGKPVLVYFTASWCDPCQEMKRTTWADQKVADRLTEFVVVKIDIDEQPAVAESFHLPGVPIFFLLDSAGKMVSQRNG